MNGSLLIPVPATSRCAPDTVASRAAAALARHRETIAMETVR